jgi:uncharacterized membrane protein
MSGSGSHMAKYYYLELLQAHVTLIVTRMKMEGCGVLYIYVRFPFVFFAFLSLLWKQRSFTEDRNMRLARKSFH